MKYKLLTFLFIAALLTACAPEENTPASVAEAPALDVNAPSPPQDAPPPDGQQPPPQGEGHVPEFNPFENMGPEQESCLRTALGDKTFTALITFQRPPSSEEENALKECLGDAFMPPEGAFGEGGDPSGGGHNPTLDQSFYTTSTDGIHWETGILLAESASVPEVMHTSDGTLWAYWVDFSEFTGMDTEKIGVARSDDNGASWQQLGQVNFTGLGSIVPVDPDVIELPDGRLRMYFYDIAVHHA